jgi:hypothetical protein
LDIIPNLTIQSRASEPYFVITYLGCFRLCNLR